MKEHMVLKKSYHKKSNNWVIYFLCIIIASFCVNSIWFNGYLNLNPIAAISNASLHNDTTIWASISEAIKNYSYPDLLINNPKYFHFHIGSEFIFAILSIIFNISVLNIYNFIFPVLCLPLYAYLIINVIIKIRKYKKETTILSVTDYFLLALFYVGFLPSIFLDTIGIWKTSVIAQEAYLFAQIFFLVYLYVLLRILNSNKLNEKTKNIFMLMINPIFIFLCSFMKISVGFLLATGIMYFIFRKHTKKLKYWIINILYFIVFIISFSLFCEATGNTPFQLLSFVRRYARTLFPCFAIFHYFVLLFFTLLFLGIMISRYKLLKMAFLNKELIVEETVLVFSIVSLLPGLVLYIDGGSAVYFSYLQEMLAIVLLLGFNIGNDIKHMIKMQCKPLKIFVLLCFLMLMLISVSNSDMIYAFVKVPILRIKTSEYFIENKSIILNRIKQRDIKYLLYDGVYCLFSKNAYLETTFIKNMYRLAEIPVSEKKQYAIFVDDNAEIWDYFKEDRNHVGARLYQAFTGIRVINAIYTDGEHMYTSYGEKIGDVYTTHLLNVKTFIINNVRTVEVIPKINMEGAKTIAKVQDLKYLIHIYHNTYQIIYL
jgi:hypothetical protein